MAVCGWFFLERFAWIVSCRWALRKNAEEVVLEADDRVIVLLHEYIS